VTGTAARPYRGVFPVAPTIFDGRGELDLDGQRRAGLIEIARRLDPLVLRWRAA